MSFPGHIGLHVATFILALPFWGIVFFGPMNAALQVARDTAVQEAERLVECKEERDSAILDRQAADEVRDAWHSTAMDLDALSKKCVDTLLTERGCAQPKEYYAAPAVPKEK